VQYLRAAALLAFSILIPSFMLGQSAGSSAAPAAFITNYQFVSQISISPTQTDLTYRADIVNPGNAIANASAVVRSLDSSKVQVVEGQDILYFGSVPAYGQVTSSNTFTVLVNASAPLDFSNLQWIVGGPLANAGPNQTVKTGGTVRLDGSRSSNPGGVGTLTYNWSFASLPAGSAAVLINPLSMTPQFAIDVPGVYVVSLTVSNGSASSSASVTISTGNIPPVANAGPNQTIPQGSTVVLDGSGSSDLDGNPLSYSWMLIALPAGSTAALTASNTVSPGFIADQPGTYVAQLIVSDGAVSSNPASVTITTQDPPPVANAGADQLVSAGALVQLNGSASTDVDGDLLQYQWSLISAPVASTATLSNPTAVNPTFTADLPGTYVAQLVVGNGNFNSLPATVTITTNNVLPPTANAGADQHIAANSTITLNGAGTDPQGRQLAFQWSLLSIPAGSTAALTSANSSNPNFTADLPGAYIAQLIVNNGSLSSAPSTVIIATTNTPPTASAGGNQNVTVGATVTLDGSSSSDPENNPLTYSWAFLTIPSGSAATLSQSNSVSPSFVADMPGTYIAQLIVNDGLINSNPATVMITAVTTPAITLGPGALALATNTPGTLSVFLSAPAGAAGQVVDLASSSGSVATAPASVTVPAGSTGANVTVTGGGIGAATITATAAGFNAASATVTVTIPAMLTLDSSSVGINRSINGTVNLSAPAPAGGVLVTLSTTPNYIAFPKPSSVTISGGQTSATFSVMGLAAGSATISAAAPGYATASTNVNVVNFGPIILQSNVTAGLGQAVPFPVTLPVPAPAGGVTVLLASGDPTKVTVSPTSVSIPVGQTTPAAQPQVTGVGFGSAGIGASADGYTSVNQLVRVTASASFSPQSLTIKGSAVGNLTLSLSGPAPAFGLTVNLSSDDTTVATVPAAVTFLPNTTTMTVPVTAVGPGSTLIHASAAPNIADTTANITVTNAGTISLLVGGTLSIGQTVPISISLPGPAPAPLTVLLISSDPSKVSIYPQTVYIAAGSQIPSALPQITGLNFGTVAIIASAPGYTAGSQAVQVTLGANFVPPTVTITGPTTATLTLNLSSPAPAGGLVVNLSSSDNTVASVPPNIVIGPQTTSATFTVTGVAAGTAIIHASAPPSIPDTTAIVTVLNPDGTPASGGGNGTSSGGNGGVSVGNVSVGQNLQTLVGITLPQAPPAAGTNVTITSSNPAALLVAPGNVAGSGSITILVPQGLLQFAVFVQGLASSGSVSLSVSTDAGDSGTGTVTLTPSAFVLIGSGGLPKPTFATSQGLNTNFLLYAAQLDASFNFVQPQQLAGGLSATVSLNSSNTNVGTIVPAQLTFNGGDEYGTVQFNALGSGTTTISMTSPTGFSAPAQAASSMNVSVTAAGLSAPNVMVGKNLEIGINVALKGETQSVVQMTVTSNDPAHLLLSATPDGVGSASIVLTLQNQYVASPGFYVQALASSGTATYTASLPGFGSTNGTVTFTPSGFMIAGDSGAASSTTIGNETKIETGTGLGDVTLAIAPTMLDSSGNVISSATVNNSNNVTEPTQLLAGGQSVSVTVNNSVSSIGAISLSPSTIQSGPVVITGGSSSGLAYFDPLGPGNTVITLSQPPGFTNPNLLTLVQVIHFQ